MTQSKVESRYGEFDKMLLNGVWRHGRSGQVSEDRDPYTDEVLVRIPLADERDLNDAFQAATRAQPSRRQPRVEPQARRYSSIQPAMIDLFSRARGQVRSVA